MVAAGDGGSGGGGPFSGIWFWILFLPFYFSYSSPSLFQATYQKGGVFKQGKKLEDEEEEREKKRNGFNARKMFLLL